MFFLFTGAKIWRTAPPRKDFHGVILTKRKELLLSKWVMEYSNILLNVTMKHVTFAWKDGSAGSFKNPNQPLEHFEYGPFPPDENTAWSQHNSRLPLIYDRSLSEGTRKNKSLKARLSHLTLIWGINFTNKYFSNSQRCWMVTLTCRKLNCWWFSYYFFFSIHSLVSERWKSEKANGRIGNLTALKTRKCEDRERQKRMVTMPQQMSH